MKTYAVAARRWAVSTWLAAGARPRLAPPLRADSFEPAVLGSGTGSRLVYVCLHGLPGQPYWYGDDWSTAITAEQVRACDMSGAVVYLAGCFGQGPMTDALIDAGARAVVGSAAEVWGGYVFPTGTNARGRAFVRAMQRGCNVYESVLMAQATRSDHPDDTLAVIGEGIATLSL